MAINIDNNSRQILPILDRRKSVYFALILKLYTDKCNSNLSSDLDFEQVKDPFKYRLTWWLKSGDQRIGSIAEAPPFQP